LFIFFGMYDYRGLVEEVGQALACTLDLETLAEVLVRQVPRAMHMPGAALWLERDGKMELAGTSVGATLAVVPQTHWAPGGQVAEPGQVRMAHDHAAVPLVVEGQVVGVWALAARPGGEWGPEDERILTALGRQAALAAQNVRLVVALRSKVAEVEEMHRRLLAACEEERADLARELHDGAIQDLIGLRYRLEACGGAGEQGSRGEAYAEAGLLVDELRRLCSALRPSALDQLGLAAALRALAREVTAQGLPVEVYLEDIALPDKVAIGLYRICQEALSNALYHAGASRAVVMLTCEEDGLVLAVADDGRGFDHRKHFHFSFQASPQCFCCYVQVVILLQSQPELRRCAKVACQPQGGVSGNAALS
jgi:nitrate/nitrite-specific signal transduction histidine kinase